MSRQEEKMQAVPVSEKPKEITDVEKLQQKIAQMREAQKAFAAFTQEQIDKIFFEAAMAANKQRIPLAKMAVEETGMGVVEDKVIKNHYAAEYIYNSYKNVKTCGVIEEDASYGIKKIAEPMGLVGAIIPTTNPTSTAIFKTLLALKTRNGMIISPHPRAKSSTMLAAKTILDAAVAATLDEDEPRGALLERGGSVEGGHGVAAACHLRFPFRSRYASVIREVPDNNRSPEESEHLYLIMTVHVFVSREFSNRCLRFRATGRILVRKREGGRHAKG